MLGDDESFVGAGCLIDGAHILTCYHVLEVAIGRKPAKGVKLQVKLIGIAGQPTVTSRVMTLGAYAKTERSLDDMALLSLDGNLDIPAAEFATPLRHGGKTYSALGFPDGDSQGRNASGILHAANADGLVQMDGNSALFVRGGFSGAPVWSPDLRAFVGMVVSELYDDGVAWCIPSQLMCRFYPDLLVRFRVPEADRPVVNDYWHDDPNVQIFGIVSENGQRRLTAQSKIGERNIKYGLPMSASMVRPAEDM